VENRDLGLCATHNKERRKVNKQPSPKTPLKRTPIRKVSTGMMKKLRVYVQLKRTWIKGKKCEVCSAKLATDVHHTKGRIGALLLMVEWWLAVCRGCHRKIEENPEWAYENGYSFSRLTK